MSSPHRRHWRRNMSNLECDPLEIGYKNRVFYCGALKSHFSFRSLRVQGPSLLAQDLVRTLSRFSISSIAWVWNKENATSRPQHEHRISFCSGMTDESMEFIPVVPPCIIETSFWTSLLKRRDLLAFSNQSEEESPQDSIGYYIWLLRRRPVRLKISQNSNLAGR